MALNKTYQAAKKRFVMKFHETYHFIFEKFDAFARHCEIFMQLVAAIDDFVRLTHC
jgi:hypothetical protein